ncbi:hypothetical protein STEG23_014945, partial [Scotinomys teguina]
MMLPTVVWVLSHQSSVMIFSHRHVNSQSDLGSPPTDIPSDNLEQKILQVLSEAGSPVKTAQLVKTCQVPKKTLNQVLYNLKKESKVSSEGPATWCLGRDAPGDEVPSIPENPTAQPSLDERVLRFLEDNGPQKALHIAKALGMKTTKEVNPHLYKMRERHLLSYDGQTWMIYDTSGKSQDLGWGLDSGCGKFPGKFSAVHTRAPVSLKQRNSMEYYSVAHSGGRQESTAIIYQQNPINMICQQGTNNHISIANSEAIQIGHGNTMLRQIDCGQRVSATTTGPGTSFTMQTPEPGPHPEGNTAQRVHIKSCLLEDATIGNSNKMTIHTTSEGGVTESGDSKETKEDTDSSSKAMPCGSCSHTPSNSTLLTSELRIMTLGGSGPKTTGTVLKEDGVSNTGSCQTQEKNLEHKEGAMWEDRKAVGQGECVME